MNLIGDAGLNEIARALGSGSAPSPAPSSGLWVQSGTTISPVSGVTSVIATVIGAGLRRIYATSAITGTTDVPSVGDFGPQFSLLNGKLWYNSGVEFRPIDQTGTVEVSRLIKFECTGAPDSGLYKVTISPFRKWWGTPPGIPENVRFEFTLTFQDQSTGFVSFTYSAVANVFPPGVSLDSSWYEDNAYHILLNHSDPLAQEQHFKFKMLCSGIELDD
jgi:hypothetical protein